LNTKPTDLPNAYVDRVRPIQTNTMEVEAVKRIIRESWQPDVKDSSTMDILNRHVDFMARELKLPDYEAACMQNVALHSKHMTKSELRAYTKLIEALAIGYKSKFGLDITNLLIAGVALLSKDLKTARKHYNNLLSDLYYNLKSYDDRIEKENNRITRLATRLQDKESRMFLFRMLNKREINALKSRINKRTSRMNKLSSRKVKYDSLATKLKSVANS
jgi:DNA repair ATPase RecN